MTIKPIVVSKRDADKKETGNVVDNVAGVGQNVVHGTHRNVVLDGQVGLYIKI